MAISKSEEEYLKAFFEYLRHLTTLSTGSIVLIAAFLEKVFQKPLWKAAVVVSLLGFMVSVLSSVVVYTILIIFEYPAPGKNLKTPEWADVLGGTGTLLTWVGFLIGILSLAVFAVRNFLQ
jgi:hypothetical protein